MTCREARDLLSDDPDAAFGRTARGDLAAHLDGCPACREERRLLDRTRWLLSTYGTVLCPVDLTSLATRRPLRAKERGALRPFRPRVAIAALALIGVVTGGWRRLSVSPPPPRPLPSQLVIRDVAKVEEIHQSFAVQESLQGHDGLLLFAPEWGDRGR